MRKKWYAFALAVILGITLCACEKTSDEKIVAQKNNERLKEEAEKGADESNSLAAVAKVYDYFFDGVETYTEVGSSMTKEMWEEEILAVKEKKAMIEADDSIDESERESQLEAVENELQMYEGELEKSTDTSRFTIDLQIDKVELSLMRVRDSGRD